MLQETLPAVFSITNYGESLGFSFQCGEVKIPTIMHPVDVSIQLQGGDSVSFKLDDGPDLVMVWTDDDQFIPDNTVVEWKMISNDSGGESFSCQPEPGGPVYMFTITVTVGSSSIGIVVVGTVDIGHPAK